MKKMIMNFKNDERAVSSQISYAIIVFMSGLILIGLATGAGTLVDSQTSTAAENEIEVTGNIIASEMVKIDNFESSGTNSVEIDSSAPDRIVGQTYIVELNQETENNAVLNIIHPSTEQNIEIPFAVESDVEDGKRVSSGNIYVTINEDDELTLVNK